MSLNSLYENKKEKIKVTEAEVIVEDLGEVYDDIRGRYYFSIKYKEVGSNEYCIGYSSYMLDYVFVWLKEYFEIVKEEPKVTEHTEISDWWYDKTDEDIKELKSQIKNINKKINEIVSYVKEEDTMLKQAFLQGKVSHSVFTGHCIRKRFLEESIDK